MRIAYISPFPPTWHGIATYTHYLNHALLKIDPEIESLIVADSRTSGLATRKLTVVPCFALAETLTEGEQPRDMDRVAQVVAEFAPDVIHIQHGPSVFCPDERFLGLLERLRGQAKLVVTLHAVHTNETSRGLDMTMSMEEFNTGVGRLADATVVHQRSMKRELIRQGVPSQRVHVIAHGTEILRQVDVMSARRSLGLPENCRIIIAFGFFGDQKHKGLLIEALPRVLDKVPDCHLFVAGHVREWIREDHEKRKLYESLSQRYGVQDRVLFAERFIVDDEIDLAFAAADLAAFPDRQDYLSASGALHLALGAFKPVVVSRVPKFEEVWTEISSEVTFDAESSSQLASILIRLLVDEDFRESIVLRVKSYAVRTAWEAIARDHLRLYDSLPVHRLVFARA